MVEFAACPGAKGKAVRAAVSANRRSRFGGLLPLTAAVCAGALLAASCDDRRPPSRPDALAGIVESVAADTGEVVVRVERPVDGSGPPRVTCLLATDAEVYINDKFSRASEIGAGDEIELIGYPDSTPRAERFVIALAHVTRPEPAPPAPEDLLPTTTAPHEEY